MEGFWVPFPFLRRSSGPLGLTFIARLTNSSYSPWTFLRTSSDHCPSFLLFSRKKKGRNPPSDWYWKPREDRSLLDHHRQHCWRGLFDGKRQSMSTTPRKAALPGITINLTAPRPEQPPLLQPPRTQWCLQFQWCSGTLQHQYPVFQPQLRWAATRNGNRGDAKLLL